MTSVEPVNAEAVAAKVKTLINNQLKMILKKESLPVSGAKATLQTRIINRESPPYYFHKGWCKVEQMDTWNPQSSSSSDSSWHTQWANSRSLIDRTPPLRSSP